MEWYRYSRSTGYIEEDGPGKSGNATFDLLDMREDLLINLSWHSARPREARLLRKRDCLLAYQLTTRRLLVFLACLSSRLKQTHGLDYTSATIIDLLEILFNHSLLYQTTSTHSLLDLK